MSQIAVIIISILLVITILSLIIRVYNKLIMLKYNVDKSFANIDVVLKQRADEIPNLVSVAKQFMNHEKETLNKLTELRTSFYNSSNQNTKTELANETSTTLKSFFALAENYPTLISNTNFLELQKRVSDLENIISDRREFFNDSVTLYNIGIKEFPNVIFATILGYQDKTLLTITEAEKTYNGIQF